MFSMMGLWKEPLVDLKEGYLNKGYILLVWVTIYGKGSVEKAKYHSKKQPYIFQSGKIRDWVKPALVDFYYSLKVFWSQVHCSTCHVLRYQET